VQLQAENRAVAVEITALRQSRDRADAAYRSGAIGLTDLLEADRELLTAQDQYAASEADTARAAVASFRALGGGWS